MNENIEKMNGMSIDILADTILNAKSIEEIKKWIPDVLNYFLDKGESNFRLNFWTKLPMEIKEQFVQTMFLFLIECNPPDKLIGLDLLGVLYLDAEPNVREKLIFIFYAALMEQKNFKLALAALSFFVHLWKNSDPEDNVRHDIFPKLLDFIENKDPVLIGEGIFETIKLLPDCSAREREEVFETLIQMGKKEKEPEAQYAIFEGINDIVTNYLADLETYPPELLTHQLLQLVIENSRIKHPKAIFAALRLIFGNKLSLSEKAEEHIFEILKRAFKGLTFEYMGMFWQAFLDFLQLSGFISKSEMLKPFLAKMKQLFTHRSEIAPEVQQVLENLITWLWENQLLSEKDRAAFY